jgi:hypothetical protein
MKTLKLYVPSTLRVPELARFVRMFGDAGYRVATVRVGDDVSEITFERQEQRE